MRLDIPIDDKLMQQALQVTGLSTEKEVVEEALRLLLLYKEKNPKTPYLTVPSEILIREDRDSR